MTGRRPARRPRPGVTRAGTRTGTVPYGTPSADPSQSSLAPNGRGPVRRGMGLTQFSIPRATDADPGKHGSDPDQKRRLSAGGRAPDRQTRTIFILEPGPTR